MFFFQVTAGARYSGKVVRALLRIFRTNPSFFLLL